MSSSFVKHSLGKNSQPKRWLNTLRKCVFHSNNCVDKPQTPTPNYRIVMVRHGESDWNKKNLFCGWYDAKSSAKGVKETAAAGETLRQGGYKFDVAHTSVLTRSQDTLCGILAAPGQVGVPVHYATWRLIERHYGGLTGLNKSETAAKYGEEQVKVWRRSFDIPLPPMGADHSWYYDRIVNDPRYAEEPAEDAFP